MQRTLLAAALAALPMLATASAQPAQPTSLRHIKIDLKTATGQSIQQAIQLARFHARMDALRAPVSASVPAAGADTKNIQPALTSGMVVSTTLTVGQATSIAEVTIGFQTGPSGLGGLELIFTSPNGNESLAVSYAPQGLKTKGTVTVEQPGNVPFYTQPGQWQLTAAYMEDYAGNFVSYTQSQLAALFPQPYITFINNGPVDITPPVVTAGQILTPTVSLSSPVPVFEATLTGTDDVSGLYQPLVGIQAPGAGYALVDEAPMPFPLLAGTGTAYSTLFNGSPTGSYTIAFYAFCDLANNCFVDQTPADIQTLFGTTSFTVTN